MLGYLEQGIQTPMAQGRSAKIIETIKWVRTSRLSINDSLSLQGAGAVRASGKRGLRGVRQSNDSQVTTQVMCLEGRFCCS